MCHLRFVHKMLVLVLSLAYSLVADVTPITGQEVEIMACGNNGEDGGVSAYITHQFKIECDAPSGLSAPSWELVMPLADGSFQSIQLPDNNFACTVPAVTEERDYRINQDGGIAGQLKFSCLMNGEKVEAAPFMIHFELKPFIEAAIEKIIDNYPLASYDAHYIVKYHGADKIKIAVEEEYSSIISSRYLNEPYICYGVADHITAPYYAWIDFSAENQYGKTIYTIELQPYGVVSYSGPGPYRYYPEGDASIIEVAAENDYDSYEVFDLGGIEIGSFESMTDIDSNVAPGIYLVRCIRNGSIVRTIKHMSH